MNLHVKRPYGMDSDQLSDALDSIQADAMQGDPDARQFCRDWARHNEAVRKASA